MTMLDNNRNHAKHVAQLITEAKSRDTGVLSGLWHWVNGIASGIGHLLGGSVTSALRAVLAAVKDEVDAYVEVVETYYRLVYFFQFYIIRRLEQYVNHKLASIQANERRDIRYVVGLIYTVSEYVLVTAARAINAERNARVGGIRHAESLAQMRLRAMHGTIEREAESGYRLHRDDRVSIIGRLLDYAVLRNPVLKDLVGTIVTGLLDLLAVDNPPARLLLGFLITKVIDRLGIDKAVGALAGDLMKPIIGDPSPKNLHDVIADIAARLAANDAQWARFMENGGAQVEQAGRDWRDITGVIGSTAIVAFTAQAIVAPDQWAREIRATIGVPANDTLTAAATLFKGG